MITKPSPPRPPRPLFPITWIIPYYRNAPMLEVHLLNWSRYSDEVRARLRVFLIDDCSPPADRPDDLLRAAPQPIREMIRLFRVLDDIPWNQHGARNLGAFLARGWLLLTDMDRVLLNADMRALMAHKLKADRFYKPVGVQMHRTLLVQDPEKGPYNQLLIHRDTYWKTGGYDEDYCGCYYGDRQFLEAVAQHAKFERIKGARMYRYNHYIVHGANTHDLDRSTDEGVRRFKAKAERGDLMPKNPVRFRWQGIAL